MQLTIARHLSTQLIPDHESVIQLFAEVKRQTTPPDWWENVQFHFHYKAVGENSSFPGSQCSGPPSPLTARVNEYTEMYTDDTDDRPGWCELKWGIMTPNDTEIEKWFVEEVGVGFSIFFA